ncbi:MAG: dihydrolipoamide acetyltransferase family protein [Eubacteriales bacterium]|nr:dihydrolipoamide acetyltransferase family protein [Eubacteriales bacterium]
MADIVVMPKMNLSMEDGLLAMWYVKEGDPIKKGDVLFSVENEKEVGDIESLYDGVAAKLLAEAGKKYDIYTPLAIIAQPGENIAEALAKIKSDKSENVSIEEAEEDVQRELSKTIILPKIRKILREKGISVEDISAKFGNVKITEKEIALFEQENSNGIKLEPNDRIEPMTSMMLAISKNMKQSCEQTARLTNFIEVDMTDAMQIQAKRNAAGEKLSVTALLIKACAYALREYDICNAVYDEGNQRIIYRGDVNVGCAVDVKGGLVVPVVKGADKKNVATISAEIAEYAKKGEEMKITSEDMSGGTFTVTSIGMFGAAFFTPIINYPQTAILGVGTIKTLPRYIGKNYDEILPRKIMMIGLTYDHRVVNGAPAARFLQCVRDILEQCRGLE